MERFINKNWLGQLTSNALKEGKINEESANNIIEYAEEKDDHTFYKYIKFSLLLLGGFLILSGLMVIVGDLLKKSESSGKIMLLIPGILGGVGYFFYRTRFRKNDLIRESATAFFFACIAGTFGSLLQAFEIEFINALWQQYLILGLGLYFIYADKSKAVTLVFLSLLVFPVTQDYSRAIPDVFTGGRGETDKYFAFLIWGFLGASAYLIKDFFSKKNKFSNIIIGWYFAYAAVMMAIFMTGGLIFFGLATVLTALYLIGCKYYSNGTWFFNRPLQTISGLFVIVMTMAMSFSFALKGAPYVDSFGDSWKFPQLISLVVIGAIGYFCYWFYTNEVENKEVETNPIMAGFPILLVLTGLFGWFDWTWHSFMFAIYGVLLGGSYLTTGLSDKYTPKIFLGTIILLPIVIGKISVNSDLLGNKLGIYLLGLLLIGFGAGMVFLVKFMKDEWSVTGPLVEDSAVENVIDSPE